MLQVILKREVIYLQQLRTFSRRKKNKEEGENMIVEVEEEEFDCLNK